MDTFQQPKITGYRQLSAAEVALMNEGKALAAAPKQQGGGELPEPVAKIHSDGYWTEGKSFKEPLNFASMELYTADQLRTAIAAERERVRLEHARELVEAHREAFVGNIEALSKLDLDAMNAQPLLMAVQNWDISTGRARELLRCWVLGTFKPDMLPECGDELFAEADEPRDAWAKLQAELSTLRQQLAEAVRERDALRSVVQSALNNNGGLIDADSTSDGKSYVMVLREDFDAIDAASRVAGT